jgi:cytochrome c oxidase assembly protein Cox11
MDSIEPNATGLNQDQRKRANRKLVLALLIMTAGAFAFGWALVPLYDVLCRAAGIGNAEAKSGKSVVRESIDPNREITIEFLGQPASVGSFDFRPKVASLRIHPGKLYDTLFYAKNLTQEASVAQAVPSISTKPSASASARRPLPREKGGTCRCDSAWIRDCRVMWISLPWLTPSTTRRNRQHAPSQTF